MAVRLRRIREFSRALPFYFYSGIPNLHHPRGKFSGSFLTPLPNAEESIIERGCHVHRCSTMSETLPEFLPDLEFLTFVESTLNELEGPYHCWLNKVEGSRESFDKNGIFLVLADAFLDDSFTLGSEQTVMFEGVKLLQQRYPKLQVFGFQSVSSAFPVATQTCIIKTIMEQYISFPVLLSYKDFTKMTYRRSCSLLFEGLRGPLLYRKMNLDLRMITKAIEKLSVLQNGSAAMVQNSKSTWMRQPEVLREPYVCSYLRNLLLYFPGGLSVDEDGNRLFLSDSNHHRIIIADGDGKILDCIGSSPGFEDGEFESSKLLRPAASFYHVAEDCLYFVDSENHAIRRADLQRRIVETIYPICDTDRKVSSYWGWISEKLGVGREVNNKSKEFDMDSITSPWHLLKSGEDNLLIINHSFETLWIMSITSGEIKEIVKGFPNILEIYGQMVMEKVSLLKQMFGNKVLQKVDASSLEGPRYVGLISSVASFQNNIIFCDAAGQRVLKHCRGTEEFSTLRFSNFGILGLPYWLACPPEKVIVGVDAYGRPKNDLLQLFKVLPGRCTIRVNIAIPVGTKLVAPLQEGCIWRQARGSVVEVSGSDGLAKSAEKVGVAQQWFDELDDLAFVRSESESSIQVEENNLNRVIQQEDNLHIDCCVNISPGISEVIVYAVLYLKLYEMQSSYWGDDDRQLSKHAEMVLDISDHEEGKKQGRDACVRLLLDSCREDLKNVVFTKPMHLRIRLQCDDHPKSKIPNEIISTDSSIEVNVSLE